MCGSVKQRRTEAERERETDRQRDRGISNVRKEQKGVGLCAGARKQRDNYGKHSYLFTAGKVEIENRGMQDIGGGGEGVDVWEI